MENKNFNKIDTRIKLSALWITHFLMWSFGDVLNLIRTNGLVEMTAEPVPDELLLFVATPLAILQTFIILFSLMGEYKVSRLANIGIAALFLLLNVGFLSEQFAPWGYLLGFAYLSYNVLVIKIAWQWKTTN